VPRAAPRPQPDRGPAASQEWRRHPVLSALLRAAVVALPAAGGLAVALPLSRALPRPTSVTGVVLWYAVMAVAMLAAVLVVERGARRLLPLAALLNVSLLFPDQAPRRFAVARRVGRPRDIERRVEELRQMQPGSSELGHMQRVLELAAALSVHDRRTRGHSERVRVFTDLIAEEMGLPPGDRARLRWASLLHDIGKLMVPTEILRKPAALDDEEWQQVRRHPAEGDKIIAPLRTWMGPWADAVVQHHERWDGRGYPAGLAGRDISLGGRIVAVADSYEVMTAPRPYRRPLGVVAARRELVRCSGAQFDPEVVRAFLNVSVGRLWRVVGVGTWMAQMPFLSWLGGLGAPWGTAVASGAGALVIALPGVLPGVALPAATPPAVVAAVAPAANPTAHPDGGQSSPHPGVTTQPGGSAPSVPTPSAPPVGSTPQPTPTQPSLVPPGTTAPASPFAGAGPPGSPSPTGSPAPALSPTPSPTALPSPSPTPTPAPTSTPSPTPTPFCLLGILCL
jgi:HD-GYP domain-containing protein (c-di-GMP phosphodiesterase class II)